MKNKSHLQDKMGCMFLPFTKGRFNKAFNISIPRTILYSSISILFFFVVTSSFAAPTTGAVKLSKKSLSKKSSFYCGKIRNKWIPGRLIAGGLFLSHTLERSNLLSDAKKAKGTKKDKLIADASKLNSLITIRKGACKYGSKSPLLFNLKNSVGIVQTVSINRSVSNNRSNRISSQGINIQAIDSSGILTNPLLSGGASISKTFISPQNEIFAIFGAQINVSDTTKSGNCNMAKIQPITGITTCIESELGMLSGLVGEHSGRDLQNNQVQFDQNGNVYYVGKSSTGLVLRKLNGTTKTDLINDNISVSNYLVNNDGSIFIAGRTLSTNATWLRKINSNGGFTNVITPASVTFLTNFSDGNTYFGDYFSRSVKRFITSQNTLESPNWIDFNQTQGVNSTTNICGGSLYNSRISFCGYGGSYIKGFFPSSDGAVTAIAGIDSQGLLIQYYPNVEFRPTITSKISKGIAVGDKLFLAGLNERSEASLSLYDLISKTEDDLFQISGISQIEIYNLRYSGTYNSMFFDGLRFSDGRYVLGRYDLTSKSFNISETGGTKLIDLQIFN